MKTRKRDCNELSKSKHGLVRPLSGIVVCVLLALLAAGKSLLFGLVMGTVYSSGLGIGGRVCQADTRATPRARISGRLLSSDR